MQKMSVSTSGEGWGKSVLSLADRCNSWSYSPKCGGCVLFHCDGVRVGLIKTQNLPVLLQYPSVFVAEHREDGSVKSVKMADALSTVEERTVALNKVFADLRDKGVYSCLKGWRNENYSVSESFSSDKVLFHCERAAARLLGMRQYGVHMNGFVRDKNGEIKMWIGRRSPTKQTYPGLLDNTVAGGVAGRASPLETVVKECEEEASIPASLAAMATPVGTISYCYDAEDGIEPDTAFMYDLELPLDFVPTPRDGEVSEYYLWGMDKIKEEIALDHFKPNCALTCVKFMIRHGLITPESEPLYEQLCSCLHTDHYSHHRAAVQA